MTEAGSVVELASRDAACDILLSVSYLDEELCYRQLDMVQKQAFHSARAYNVCCPKNAGYTDHSIPADANPPLSNHH